MSKQFIAPLVRLKRLYQMRTCGCWTPRRNPVWSACRWCPAKEPLPRGKAVK